MPFQARRGLLPGGEPQVGGGERRAVERGQFPRRAGRTVDAAGSEPVGGDDRGQVEIRLLGA